MALKEFKAAHVNDLKNGEMKSVSVGDGKEILLVKLEDKFYAHGAHCTHYGAPLAEGVLHNSIIMCPWHHACFNAKNGDMVEPPARDSLPNYEVKIVNNDVIVMLPDELPMSRKPEMVKHDPEDKKNYIILGGGAAGNAAAQALREAGYKGNITIITKEARFPYDRPNLSKAYLSGEAPSEWMPLRDKDFYEGYNINFLFSHKVEEINIDKKEICLDNNHILKYDKILLAPGGIPRKLDIPGCELDNIFYLRSFDDCDKIIETAGKASKAVVIGSSFIGMESAYHIKERNIDVTIISKDDVPFKKILGKEVGSLIKNLHENHGIKFKSNTEISRFEGERKVEAVVLSSGEKIDCDFVIVGIGVKPGSELIKGLNLEKDGSVKVNEYLQAAEDVYAAGDIASFPFNNKLIRIEHWRFAEQQGRVAGFNMAGKNIKFNKQPFFWTEQAGLNLRYVGYADNWDESLILGDLDSKEFILFLSENGKIKAAIGNNKDTEMDAVEILMNENRMPSLNELKEKQVNLVQLVNN